ncbi:MAG: ATP-binding protein, partial [Bdellovibrionaceae bacterium]|nr:ATP-binding protein [Pseudobdellovibrionaceae bacterium]
LVILLKAIASTEKTQYSVRIHQNFPAELGQIATEFNKAMEKVQESENKLLSQNQNLEYLVSERTHQLDEQRAQMINSSRLASLGEFSAGISHEINNPLAVIHGNSRILLNHINSGKLDRQFEGPISKIKLMTERIQKIIKNLRTFARDGEKDEKQLFEIAKFIDEIHLLAKVKLDKSQIAFEFLNLSSLTHLYGQEVPLSQVIINLINNSADAISEQNEKWVKVSIEKDNHSAVIKITDSGHGIPATIQTKMMNPFFTTKEVGKGTGLGLSISLGIIKNHGGEFYYNKEAKNTQFIIKLPINEHLSQAI